MTWVIVSPCANREIAPALDHTLFGHTQSDFALVQSNGPEYLGSDVCIGSSTGVRFGGAHPGTLQLWAKRAIDVALTSVALLVGLPFLAVICLLIRLTSRGPIFYSQRRIGLGGEEF